MNAFFYPRLALSGMRRDRRIYAPYLAACVFMTAVVYDLAFLADSPVLYAVGSGVNGMGTSAIRLVMTLGKWVMAVFALLFFFYTNAFLIRRKKELGLMSVLGMDRRRAHLASFLGDRLLRARLPHRGTRPRRAAHAALRPACFRISPGTELAHSAAAGSWQRCASAS